MHNNRILHLQAPFTYQHRQPVIYRNPTNAQNPVIRNAQTPVIYQVTYQFLIHIGHRSLIRFHIQQQELWKAIAKVKGVYLNDGGTLRKLEEVYVNDNGTAEKIHQSVPTARFSKNPSNTQV